MSPTLADRAVLDNLIGRDALFFVSHSGGRDSQAMYLALRNIVPGKRIVVVHADLGKVEWLGVKEHIRSTIHHHLHVVQATKTFFDMVRRRREIKPLVPSFPSSQQRQCTSDLKRDPIAKLIRAVMKERGATLAINCMGLRSEESAARAKRKALTLNSMLSKAGREVHDYLPLHHWSTQEVFASIRAAGQEPFWAYGLDDRGRVTGNERLSCVFCIFGSPSDIAHGREHRPELFDAYVELERETGYTIFPKESLTERADRGRRERIERRLQVRVEPPRAGPPA